MNENPVLAVIGGSGLYEFDDITDIETTEVSTPFGDPSSPITTGILNGKKVAFLARHGIGHIYSPSEVPYRANMYALKSLGVKRIVSVSACGSLREAYAPGNIVIPDQIFDFTHKRDRSFFGGGLVAHVSVADPFCKSLSDVLEEAVKANGATLPSRRHLHHHRGAAFLHQGRIPDLSPMGAGYHRHDRLARGLPGKGSRDVLHHHGPRDRL